MRQFNVLFRWGWTILVVATLALAGCEGDDGAPGATGARGQDGTDGTAGGPGLACWDLDGDTIEDPEEDINGDGVWDAADCSGTAAKVTPLESCGVCHDDGSLADAGAAHALPPIESVSNVTFLAVAPDLTVTFDLADDTGAPLMTYDEVMRVYVNNGGTVTDYRDVATMANNGGGNYTITVAGAAAEALVDNRWLFRIRDSVAEAANDSEFRTYFHADNPNNPFAADGPLAVGGDACAACHGPEGIRIHGSHFIASDGGEPCLACHGATDGRFGAVPSLAVVAHEYHSGLLDEITYPTYMTNCSVCHSEEAQLTAVNAMPVSGAGCFTCHGSMVNESWDFTGLGFHLTLANPETADCTVCHKAAADGGIAQANVAEMHNGALTGRNGVIWDGVDLSVTEGAKIDWQITGVVDDGTDLAISWTATYDNGTGPVAVDPCNATAGAGAPLFFADVDADGDSLGNLSILRNYAQGEDFILGTDPDEAGQPGGTPGVSADNTTCTGLVATTVVPVEATNAMYGRVAIQGKPRLPSPDPDDTDGLMQVRAFTPTYDWVVGDGAAAPPRRAVVDSSLCLSCHVGSLYQHGGNRVDNVDMCYLCHNAAANDQYVRAGFGVDASEAYDGRAGQAFGIKEMVHAVHPAGATGNPVVIYRGRGIYGFATSVDQLRNWPTESDCVYGPNNSPGNIVVGSDADTATLRLCQPHNFESPTYPRSLNDCAACHVADVSLLPDKTKAMATTVEAGAPPFGDQLNDVLQGAQTTSCITCHADSASTGHAYQNSWTPQAFPEGRQTIIDAK